MHLGDAMPQESEPSPSAQTTGAVKPQGSRLRVEAPTVGRRVLRLIRRYLNAGVLANGVVIERHEGTPQGGPLSPLLANVLLDEVDKELERRGHAFVRYADDLNVYVRSQRAGERVMASLRKLFGKLKLRINENKSKVTRATKAKFLGFCVLQRHMERSSVELTTVCRKAA
jgi:retron-type reverse transcriptase